VRLRLALLLALAAAACYFGIDAPARGTLQRALDEQRRLRAERREVGKRLLPLERAEAARARALEVLRATPLPAGQEAQTLRRTVLTTIAGEPLSGQRVAVRVGRGEAAAAVELACEGALETVLRSLTRLTRPGSGLVLARARLAAAPSGVALELLAEGVRAQQ
jgi:hypothetical protein